MTTYSLEQLTTPLTRAEVEAAIYAAIVARGGDPTVWKAGSPTRSIVTGASIVISSISKLVAAIAKGGFLELAEGDWLELVAYYVYGVEKLKGTFAAGDVVIDNTAGGVWAFDPGDLLVINPITGKGYRNVAAVSIGALEEDVVVAVQAVELGSDSTSLAGQINAFGSSIPGLVVTNPSALIGTDPETDPALRERCAEKLATLSPNGPREAYSFVAKSAKTSSGTSAGVTRVRTVADGFGNVIVYVATATGSITGSIGDTSTALGAVDEAIQTLCVPLAVTATTTPATPKLTAVTYVVWVRNTSGKTAAEIKALIDDALAAFIATIPIGGHKIPAESTGRVYKSAIEATIDAALEDLGGVDFVIRRTVSIPAVDTDLLINEAPALGAVAGTVHLVSEAGIA